MTRLRASFESRRRASPRRSGYTLIEMLIASILIATLMATVWNLTTLYTGFLSAGRAQAEEQQLARSLIDIISADLRTVIPDKAGETSLRSPSSIPATQTDGFPSINNPFADDVEFTSLGNDLFGLGGSGQRMPSFAVRGTAHSLTLTVAQTEPQFEPLPIDEETGMPVDEELSLRDEGGFGSRTTSLPGPARAPEFRRIVYRFEPPRVVTTNDYDHLLPGLHRYEIPVEHLGLLTQDEELPGADTFSGEADVSDLIDLLVEQGVTSIDQERVPEVMGCEFEYLSEDGWQSSWTAQDANGSLRAIRIRLRLLSPEEQQELMIVLGVTDEPDDTTTDSAAFESVLPVDLDTTNEDPFDAFEPRMFERIILMSPPQRLRSAEDERSAGNQSAASFGPSPFGRPAFGGQP